MTEKEIMLARERYNEVVPNEKKENLEQMKNEAILLEQNDIIKKYIELKKQITMIDNEINNSENLIFAFDSISMQTKQSSNLYLAIGYFSSVVDIKNFVSLNEKNPNSHYKYYINIETCEVEVINAKDVKEFEQNNNIINSELVLTRKVNFLDKLEDIRKIYFGYLLEENEEIAIQKTKKKVEHHEI